MALPLARRAGRPPAGAARPMRSQPLPERPLRRGPPLCYSWGAGRDGQLALGAAAAAQAPTRCCGAGCAAERAGQRLAALDSGHAADGGALLRPVIAAGYRHSAWAVPGGTVLCAGATQHGRAGARPSEANLQTFQQTVQVPAVAPGARARVVAVSAGFAHTLALTDAGTLWAWGFGGDGALGDGRRQDTHSPVTVKLPPGAECLQASAGGLHSAALCVVAGKRRALTWGCDKDGRLGRRVDAQAPAEAPGFVASSSDGADADEKEADCVAAGYRSTAIVLGGTLLTCGEASGGVLGRVAHSEEPWRLLHVEALLEECRIVTVGGRIAAAVGVSGALYAWGAALDCEQPKKVPLSAAWGDVVGLSAGNRFVLGTCSKRSRMGEAFTVGAPPGVVIAGRATDLRPTAVAIVDESASGTVLTCAAGYNHAMAIVSTPAWRLNAPFVRLAAARAVVMGFEHIPDGEAGSTDVVAYELSMERCSDGALESATVRANDEPTARLALPFDSTPSRQRYTLRVRAVAADGSAGAWSEGARFTQPLEPPTLGTIETDPLGTRRGALSSTHGGGQACARWIPAQARAVSGHFVQGLGACPDDVLCARCGFGWAHHEVVPDAPPAVKATPLSKHIMHREPLQPTAPRMDYIAVLTAKLRRLIEREACASRDNSRAWRVWATSDIHTDHATNFEWVQGLPNHGSCSALIVAGDVATSLDRIADTLRTLQRSFGEVFYCVGNHELWNYPTKTPDQASSDSAHKLVRIVELCERLGVHVTPARVGGCLVIPLFSWYKRTLFGEHLASKQNLTQTERYFDAACQWPPQAGGDPEDERLSTAPGIADFMLTLNAPAIEAAEAAKRNDPPDDIISFSHFVPLPQLYRGYAGLEKLMGCTELGEVVTKLAPRVHIFGHSHLRVDMTINGTRYVQRALGYPKERWGAGAPEGVPMLVHGRE